VSGKRTVEEYGGASHIRLTIEEVRAAVLRTLSDP
jgi:hypothetical protein